MKWTNEQIYERWVGDQSVATFRQLIEQDVSDGRYQTIRHAVYSHCLNVARDFGVNPDEGGAQAAASAAANMVREYVWG